MPHQQQPAVLPTTRRRERGETLVEFALTFTIFLMTILGTMEFGIAVFRYNMLSNLAQEGARWASVRGKNAGVMAADEAAVKTFVSSRSLGILSPPNVKVFSVTSGNVCTNVEVNPSALDRGEGVCVKVQHNFSPMTRIIPLATLPLTSTAQMIITR